jgi:hypothetical protein
MLLARALVLFLVPAGCASMPVASAPQAAADPFGLPAPSGPLEFPPDTPQIELAWLVAELARLTGQELVVDPQARALLQQATEPLELLTPVPTDEVYAFVEALLVSHDFYLAPLKGGTRPMLGIYSMTARGGASPARPVVVAPAHLAELERHPALYCQMLLTFENIDTRQLQTQLRQLLVDQSGVNQVVPCGERALLIQGTSTRISGLARILPEVDRASVPRAASPGEAPPPERSGLPGPQGPPR